jgi:hypothetical protein
VDLAGQHGYQGRCAMNVYSYEVKESGVVTIHEEECS